MDALAVEGVVAMIAIVLLALVGILVYYAVQALVRDIDELIDEAGDQFDNIGDEIIIITANIEQAIESARATIIARANQLEAAFVARIDLLTAEVTLWSSAIRDTWLCTADYYNQSLLNALDGVHAAINAQSDAVVASVQGIVADLPDVAIAIVDATSAILGC